MPHPGEGVLDAGSDAAMLRVVRLLTGQEWSAGPFAMRDDEAGMDVGPVAGHRDTFAVLGEAGAAPDLAVGPVSWGGRAVATTRRVSASMMTCTFAENR